MCLFIDVNCNCDESELPVLFVRCLMPPTPPERGGISSLTLQRTVLTKWETYWWLHLWSFIFQTGLQFLLVNFLFKVFFIESICDDPDVIATNILVNNAVLLCSLITRGCVNKTWWTKCKYLFQRKWRCPAQITLRGTEKVWWRTSWSG